MYSEFHGGRGCLYSWEKRKPAYIHMNAVHVDNMNITHLSSVHLHSLLGK